jgi:YcxB-like protein
VTFTCQLAPEDYILATRLQLGRVRPFLKVLLWAIMAPCAALGLFLEVRQALKGHPDWMALFLPLAIGYLPLYWYVLLPKKMRKIFRQQRALQVPVTVELSASEFKGTSSLGTFRMPLKDFHKWILSKDMILLFHSDAVLHMLPRRCFASQEDFTTAAGYLREALGKEK